MNWNYRLMVVGAKQQFTFMSVYIHTYITQCHNPFFRSWVMVLINSQKSVPPEHYDVTVKLTINLEDIKCHCFRLLDICGRWEILSWLAYE